jgi:16S rRNA (uracil1498-N3)-methyltransferase
MRAIFFPFEKIEKGQMLPVNNDVAKHLNVVRVKRNDEILVLNGKGLKAIASVGEILKNQVELLVKEVVVCERQHQISLAIALPKKDAFEDILKMAVELGAMNIYPLSSSFSQYDYVESERIQRILESALIQSNNPFMPVIHSQIKLDSFLNELKLPLVFFNSKPIECGKGEKILSEKIILIGPEGGFSDIEEKIISSNSNVITIHLPTPILRAPTAVATSMGYLLSHP